MPALTQEPTRASQGSIFESWRVQDEIIGKLIRHILRTRYKRSRFGFAWAFLQPCLHMVLWWAIMTFIRERHDRLGMAPILILASGFIPLFLFRGPVKVVSGAIRSGRAMLRHPQVRPIDLIAANFLVEGLTMVAVGMLIFGSLIALGMAHFPRDPLALCVPVATLLFFGLGVGTFFAFASLYSSLFTVVLNGAMRVLYFTSGVFFLGNRLPGPMMEFFLWNPIFHCVEIFREDYFYNFRNDAVSIWYPLAWAAAFLLLGLAMERVTRGMPIKKERSSGLTSSFTI